MRFCCTDVFEVRVLPIAMWFTFTFEIHRNLFELLPSLETKIIPDTSSVTANAHQP